MKAFARPLVRSFVRPLAGAAAGIACATVFAQVPEPPRATLKTDGAWRLALGLGASYASGNTRASTLSLSGDAVRASETSKWTLGGRYLNGRSNGTTSADQTVFGTRYDRDVEGPWFQYGQAGYLRDPIANVSAEYSVGAGIGRHLVRGDAHTFDVFAGLGYVHDDYVASRIVAGQLRDRYDRPEVQFGEESSHRLSGTATLKQRLSYYPALRDGARRALFDASLVVAIDKSFALNATLAWRYNSEPGEGLKTSDTLLITGITYRFD